MDDESKPCAFCSMTDSVVSWFEHPFQPQGSALNWWLFLGLLLVILWFWQWTLLFIFDEVK